MKGRYTEQSLQLNVTVWFDLDTQRRRSVINVDNLMRIGKNQWWISRLLVDDSCQGQGVGPELLRRAIALIAKMDVPSRITVAPGGYGTDEEWLRGWYMRQGFKPTVNDEGLLELFAR